MQLQVIPETTPKGECMTRIPSLAPKQLWVNKTELAPIVQIQVVSDRETDHTSSKFPLHPSPNRQKPDESKGLIRIHQHPSCNKNWDPNTDKECGKIKGMFNQTGIDFFIFV